MRFYDFRKLYCKAYDAPDSRSLQQDPPQRKQPDRTELPTREVATVTFLLIMRERGKRASSPQGEQISVKHCLTCEIQSCRCKDGLLVLFLPAL